VKRELEPELMEGVEQASAYAAADFATVNAAFAEAFQTRFASLEIRRIIDLGCGPADIPVRLASSDPELMITAVDGSGAMLEAARARVRDQGLSERVRLVEARIPGVVEAAGSGHDAVISNSLLHHLPDPRVLWREILRLGRRGAAVMVGDLRRPESREEASAIVERYSGGEPEILRRDFYVSLLAAFTVAEVASQLEEAGLAGHLEIWTPTDRHLYVAGRLPF
jgi:ubiquinone/menaquinone biosynthesis C-methylase UbiE